MTDPTFRPARLDELELLDEMTLAGVRYHGHHEKYPDAYGDLVGMVGNDDASDAVILDVLERDGEVVAFYDIRDRGDYLELVRMFQRVDVIGSGYGRTMWEHAVDQARRYGDRMLIMSDPEALGFYDAMGAKFKESLEVSPGFHLGVYWFDLAQ